MQSEQKIINQLNYTDMKNVSEKTLITCMVNLKCLGYFGRCFRPFTKKERIYIVDSLIERKWLTEKMTITNIGDSLIKSNLDLLQS